MARVEVIVTNASGTVQGEGPITNVLNASLTRRLDGAGEMSITLPAEDTRVQDLVDNERRLKLYVYEPDADQPGSAVGARRLLGIGVARKIQGQVDAGKATLTISGPDELVELAHVNAWLARIYEGGTVASVASNLIALASGWSITTTDTPLRYVFARFDGASVLKALQEIAKRYGLHFRWDSSQTVKFGPLGDAAPVSLIQAGHAALPALSGNDDVALIQGLTYLDDSEEIVNKIVAVGGGQGNAALTLEHSTRGSDRYDALAQYSVTGKTRNQKLQCTTTSPTREKLAQSFTLSDAGWIKAVSLYLSKAGSPVGTLTLRIETDSGGSPSGTIAHASASKTLAESGLGTDYEMERLAFSSGFYLAAGTYWLVLSTSRAASATNYIQWGADASSPAYTGGEMKYYASSAWSAENKDAQFRAETLVDSRTSKYVAQYGIENRDTAISLKRLLPEVELGYSGASFLASSTWMGFGPSNAFDNNTTSTWVANAATGWIEVQFASAETVQGYSIVSNSASGLQPQDWTFEYWNGSSWVAIDTQAGESFSGTTANVYALASSQTAQRFRLNVSASSGAGLDMVVHELNILSTVGDNNEKLAQSFTLSAATRVSEIALWLAKKGSPTGSLTVAIETDSSGDPSGTAVTVGSGTSDTVAASSLAAQQARTAFTFTNPPYLGAGTYWAVLETTDSSDAADFVTLAADGSAPGLTGGELKSHDGSTWSAESKDAIIEVIAECEEHPYSIQSFSGPDGETLYYLEDSASSGTYGTIERVVSFNIAPLSHTATALENAADALYDAAAAWLQRAAQKQVSYSVTVTKMRGATRIKPGQRIRLRYTGMVTDVNGDEVTWRDVDDTFWVRAVSENPVSDTVSLQLAQVDKAEEGIEDLIVGMIETVRLKDTQVKPYPAVFQDTTVEPSYSALTYGRNGTNVQIKRAATAVLQPNESILSISRIVMRVKSYPLYTLAFYDNINAAAEADVVGIFAVIEDDRYPASIGITVNGALNPAGLVGEVSETTGPWLTDTDQNEQFDERFDITDLLLGSDSNIYEDVVVEVRAGYRAVSSGGTFSIPSFSGGTYTTAGEPTGGIFRITFEIHCVTQAIKLT